MIFSLFHSKMTPAIVAILLTYNHVGFYSVTGRTIKASQGA